LVTNEVAFPDVIGEGTTNWLTTAGFYPGKQLLDYGHGQKNYHWGIDPVITQTKSIACVFFISVFYFTEMQNNS
jgi:hypothetical protein